MLSLKSLERSSYFPKLTKPVRAGISLYRGLPTTKFLLQFWIKKYICPDQSLELLNKKTLDPRVTNHPVPCPLSRASALSFSPWVTISPWRVCHMARTVLMPWTRWPHRGIRTGCLELVGNTKTPSWSDLRKMCLLWIGESRDMGTLWWWLLHETLVNMNRTTSQH